MNKTQILAALKARIIRPSRFLGQNFLLDHNFLSFIVSAADLNKDELVLEIGSGPGLLTELLLEKAGGVLAVELDARLIEVAKELLLDPSNVEFIHTSIIDKHSAVSPEVLVRAKSVMAEKGLSRMKVVSNLPYSIAGQTIIAVLESDLPVQDLFVLVQWEVGLRMTAEPPSTEYGLLTALAGALSEARIVRKVPPNVFWPRPEVDSALMHFRRRSADGIQTLEWYGGFKKFLKDAFAYKRKTLLNGFKRADCSDAFLASAERFLLDAGLTVTARPQELGWKMYLDLFEAFGKSKA